MSHPPSTSLPGAGLGSQPGGEGSKLGRGPMNRITPKLSPLRPESPGLLRSLPLPYATNLGDSSWVLPTRPCLWVITLDLWVCLHSWLPERLSLPKNIVSTMTIDHEASLPTAPCHPVPDTQPLVPREPAPPLCPRPAFSLHVSLYPSLLFYLLCNTSPSCHSFLRLLLKPEADLISPLLENPANP